MFKNIFNAAKMVGFNIVTSAMGEPATWETNPAVTGIPQVSGYGLFAEPTGADQFVSPAARSKGAEYNSTMPTFRYKIGHFPGLFEYVREGNTATLRLHDGRRFLIGDFEKKFDGDTLVALLEPITRNNANAFNSTI